MCDGNCSIYLTPEHRRGHSAHAGYACHRSEVLCLPAVLAGPPPLRAAEWIPLMLWLDGSIIVLNMHHGRQTKDVRVSV